MKRKSKRKTKRLTLRDASLALMTIREFANLTGAVTTRGVAIATHLESLEALLCCAHLCDKAKGKRRG